MGKFIVTLCIISILAFIVTRITDAIARAMNKENEGKSDGYGGRYEPKKEIHLSILFLIVPIILIIALNFLAVIPAQECGVVVTPSGVKKESYKTGWHIIMPWYDIKKMDKTIQVYTCASLGSRNDADESDIRMSKAKKSSVQGTTIWAPTIDGIKMGFAISASWRIDPEYAWWIYDNVSELDGADNGRFYWLEENVIKAKLKSSLSLIVSRYTPIEVYSNKREEIQQLTFEKMSGDIKRYHLVLEQIDIREVYYNEEYEKSVNQKKLEEQKALTLVEITKQKDELLKQAEIEKNIEITKAEAEAQALKIKGQSIASNPRIVELEWINKWDGKLPTYMLGSNTNMLVGMPNN